MTFMRPHFTVFGGYLLCGRLMHNGAMSQGTNLTHINESGEANMVDVSDKETSQRIARAQAVISMQASTIEAINSQSLAKGEVLAVARVAGIQAAKKCSDLIPLCHPLPISKVSVDFEQRDDATLVVTTECRVTGKTGVEMEALTAAGVAALTVYDMCKAVDKAIVIGELCLVEKSGGKSGTYKRAAP